MESDIPIDASRDRRFSKIYAIDGEKVAVTWKQFQPVEPGREEPAKKTGIIFNTGWSLPAHGRAVAPLCQAWANVAGVPTYAVDIRGEQPSATQRQGAEAVRQFITLPAVLVVTP